MSTKTLACIIFLTIGLSSTEAKSASENSAPEVTIGNGVIRGKTLIAPNGEEVYAFYGIPYAKPPIGKLRFKKPEEFTEKWEEPFDATHLPNACPQTVNNDLKSESFDGESTWNPNTQMSEDCLFLNIWVPASVFTSKNASVLFWIFGGGFYSGSISLDVYNGHILASYTHMIVASVQYRLGPFGFLYLGNDEAPGNMGMLDQNLGLKWINKNIRAFGGNPNEITLFGESAGSVSVSSHLLSEMSQNLFKRAVMMSNSANGKWAYICPKKALKRSLQIAKSAGCDYEINSKELYKCLENATVENLNNALWTIDVPGLGIPLALTKDNNFLKDTPTNLMQRRDRKRADILVGNTFDEGSYFLVYKFKNILNPLNETFVNYDGFLTMMREYLREVSTEAQDAILNHYTNWENPEDGYKNPILVSDFIGDQSMNCPLRQFADEWSGRGLKVYYYLFNHYTESDPWGKWLGTKHGDEIAYFFGQPLGNKGKYTEEEQELSKKMMDILKNFATTGKPTETWKEYSKEFPHYVELKPGTTLLETSSGLGPRARSCAFWNIYLPQLEKSLLKKCHTDEAQTHDHHHHHHNFNAHKTITPAIKNETFENNHYGWLRP